MGEVAKKKSATWRADAGSQKKKEKKEEERRWNSTKKKGTKKETPVYLPSTVCWNTAPVFFFFFFFHVVAAREELSLEGRGPLSWASLGSFVIFVLSVTGFRVMLRGCLWLSFFFFFFCFFWFVGSVCVCFHLMVDSLGEPRIFVGLCFRPGKTHTLKRKEKKKNGLSDRPVALPFIIIIIIF